MEKQRKLKVIILSTLIVGVLTISVAFSALSRTLDIGGVGKMDTATWDVHFENLSDATITRDAIEINKPNISLDKGTVENINVKLTKPKDEIKYVVDIVNKGTIDAEVNVMTISDLTDEEKKLIDFGVYYLNGTKINKYDLLEPGDIKSIAIKIRYKDDITEFDLPSEPLEIKLSCQIEYVQSDAEIVITPENNLENVTSVLAKNSTYNASDTFFNGTITKEKIESITFLSTLKVPTEARNTAWDASLDKDGSVVAWYTDLDGNDLYELNIGGNKKVYAPSSSGLFYSFTKLKQINFNNAFDTSNVTSMSSMFRNCSSLLELDLSSFNTSRVQRMEIMFYDCKSLKSINLSSFDTKKVVDMQSMFYNCKSLETLDLSNFNTEKVIAMLQMFYYCSSLKDLDLSNFNTTNVTSMSYMFNGCSSLTNLNISNFNTTNVTSMNSMFSSCVSLTDLDVSSFNTEKVTDIYSMFSYCKKLVTLDLSSFDISNVTRLSSLFSNCISLINLELNNFNGIKVTDTSSMFWGCSSLKKLNIKLNNTNSLKNMTGMFYHCSSLENLDLSTFDTTNVTTMEDLFRGCSSLKSINLSSFNTTNVTDMSLMFYECSSLTNLDLSMFNTSNVKRMGYLVAYCSSLSNLNLSNFDFTKVENCPSMFLDTNKNLEVIVTNEEQETWLTKRFSNINIKVLDNITFNLDSLLNKSYLFIYS